MDGGLSVHVLDVARRMDTYLFILGDHGVRYGPLRQAEAGMHEESGPATFGGMPTVSRRGLDRTRRVWPSVRSRRRRVFWAPSESATGSSTFAVGVLRQIQKKHQKKTRAHVESNPALWVVVPAQFETTARLLTIFRNQVECSIECSIECSMARWQRSMAMFDGNVRDNGKAICLNQHLLVPMYNVMYFRRLFGACRLRTTGG